MESLNLQLFSQFKFNKKDFVTYEVIRIWTPEFSENIIISYLPIDRIVSNESMMHYGTKKYIVTKY